MAILCVSYFTLILVPSVVAQSIVNFQARHTRGSIVYLYQTDKYYFDWSYVSGNRKEAWLVKWWQEYGWTHYCFYPTSYWDNMYINPNTYIYEWWDEIDVMPGDSFKSLYGEEGPWVSGYYNRKEEGWWTTKARFSLYDREYFLWFFEYFVEDSSTRRYAEFNFYLDPPESTWNRETITTYTLSGPPDDGGLTKTERKEIAVKAIEATMNHVHDRNGVIVRVEDIVRVGPNTFELTIIYMNSSEYLFWGRITIDRTTS